MPLFCERRGSVAVLTLSRPEARNAWCEEFQTGLVQRLPELVGDLSPASRAVIVLFYLHEMSLVETAAVLEIPVGTVKSRLAYGLESLRRRLET